jgi:hypothetical protein
MKQVLCCLTKKCSKKSVSNMEVRKGHICAPNKKKIGGALHHSVISLKKVARLPSKDRKEILRILRRKVRKRSGRNEACGSTEVVNQSSVSIDSSSTSVNNDWQHWVVMHGNEKVGVEDVWGVGKAIGVKFNGDLANMFNILSRAGKGKKKVGEGEKRGAEWCGGGLLVGVWVSWGVGGGNEYHIVECEGVGDCGEEERS